MRRRGEGEEGRDSNQLRVTFRVSNCTITAARERHVLVPFVSQEHFEAASSDLVQMFTETQR